MNSATDKSERMLASDWLLIALVVSLAFPKPSFAGMMVATDLIFIALAIVAGLEILLGRRPLRWRPAFAALLFYTLSFIPSLLVTPAPDTSLIKLAGIFYLAALAGLTCVLAGDEAALRRVILAWLAATAFVSLLAVSAIAAFYARGSQWLIDFTQFGYGSVPAGPYPRLTLSFANANMACNYLTVSLGLALAASASGWIGKRTATPLLGGIALAAFSTLSPGIGGIALVGGLWLRLERGAKLALTGSIVLAVLFTIALAVTPFPYSPTPWIVHLPGNAVIAAAPRLQTWTAAALEFVRHPLVGHGVGIGAVDVQTTDPQGYGHELTDAHNMFLNIAAQAGIIGLIGLIILLRMIIRLTRPVRLRDKDDAIRLGIGISLLVALVYEGLGGSFEDARHLWVAIGLLISLSGGNSRRAGEPSPG
jgi:O-antigen ligase